MASALLVVMVLGGILCLFVMYYLSLVQQQNTLSVRSQAWNLAIAVTEAGIEDGLQALNSNAFSTAGRPAARSIGAAIRCPTVAGTGSPTTGPSPPPP